MFISKSQLCICLIFNAYGNMSNSLISYIIHILNMNLNDIQTLKHRFMNLIIALFLLDAVVIALISIIFKRHYREVERRSENRLRYIRLIIEIIYLHKHNPNKLIDHLMQEANIRKMLIYNIIDDNYKPYCGNIKAREEDKLLYMLHMQGFAAKELCIIFGLNNVHSVQVKYSRMNINLNKKEKGRLKKQHNQHVTIDENK